MNDLVAEKLSRTPAAPGVYMMKDERGTVIYVGKASNLRKRLSSYFARSTPPDMKTGVLVKQIADFDTIVTATEKEALILESNLIKRHHPRYNVVLKDDKRYPVLRLDVRKSFPNLTVARKIQNDGALYFGPYSSSSAVRQTLKFIDKIFKLRKCRSKDVKPRSRPCLHCQMEGCLAPCCMDVREDDYDKVVKEVVMFLKGRTPELVRDVRDEMKKAADDQNFEKAAKLRDKLFALQKTLEKQVSVTADFVDRDVLAVAGKNGLFAVTKLVVRSGFLVGSRNYEFSDVPASKEEILEAFVKQHYEEENFVPKELLLSETIPDAPVMEEWLESLKGQKVKIMKPQRGEKARLTKMAGQNALNALEERIASMAAEASVSKQLQKSLRMDKPPVRIECFDNSNISGAQPSAGMVVFQNGRPDKSSYRKYKIKTVKEQDDYAYMKEVLGRRFGKGKSESSPNPDVLMVDGGRGQLGVAVAVLEELGIAREFVLVGIAKKDPARGETKDKIYVPGRANPVDIPGEALLFLQRIRDEAHRFAVAFHRSRRNKAAIRSALDEVPGIGKKRRTALLKRFGSVSKIGEASPEEIASVPGMNGKIAEQVLEYLKREE